MVAEVVVVPAYNEGKTIAAVIAKIKTHPTISSGG